MFPSSLQTPMTLNVVSSYNDGLPLVFGKDEEALFPDFAIEASACELELQDRSPLAWKSFVLWPQQNVDQPPQSGILALDCSDIRLIGKRRRVRDHLTLL